ncbi:MAG: glycosyltransferase [Bacteroidetes bacterium]|nr:glycosyltransferase [Bacteroidota bacterium]
MENKKVSVILPAYNEKDSILMLVPAIHEAIAGYDHDILVVDDNSPDGTYKALLDLNLSYVKAILRETDRGFAKSIRCGIENASGDIIVVMDSDFNHLPKYLPIMIDNLKYYDCVIGSRFLYFPLEKHYNLFRIISSWMFNLFIRFTLLSGITENLFGYFAIKKEVIYKCDFNKIFFGFGDYYMRLLYFLQKKNCSILQIPAIFGQRNFGVGNKNLIPRVFRYTKELLLFRIRNL